MSFETMLCTAVFVLCADIHWIDQAVLCNYLIDGVCFCVIFVVPSAAVSRHGRIWVILSHLLCTMYTQNMATATLNINKT